MYYYECYASSPLCHVPCGAPLHWEQTSWQCGRPALMLLWGEVRTWRRAHHHESPNGWFWWEPGSRRTCMVPALKTQFYCIFYLFIRSANYKKSNSLKILRPLYPMFFPIRFDDFLWSLPEIFIFIHTSKISEYQAKVWKAASLYYKPRLNAPEKDALMRGHPSGRAGPFGVYMLHYITFECFSYKICSLPMFFPCQKRSVSINRFVLQTTSIKLKCCYVK